MLQRRSRAAVETHEGAQPPHHFRGALDLSGRLFGGRGECGRIGGAFAQRVVDEAGVGARRRQRLVDLMRDGGCELAEIAEPRHLRERFPVQPKLPFGAAALRDERAGDEAGSGEDEHQHLERHQILRIVAEQLDAGDEAELRQQNTEADALEPASAPPSTRSAGTST